MGSGAFCLSKDYKSLWIFSSSFYNVDDVNNCHDNRNITMMMMFIIPAREYAREQAAGTHIIDA